MITVILLVLLFLPAWSIAQESEETKEPSLFDLARQERERREALTEIPVITNANIKRLGGGLVSTAQGPGTETEAIEGEGEAEVQESKETDPAVWDGRFAEARLNLENAANRDLVLQLKMQDLRNEYLASGVSDRSRIQSQLLETQQEIETNTQNVQLAREAISTLQGEAAKEGMSENRITDLSGDSPPEGASMTPSPAE